MSEAPAAEFSFRKFAIEKFSFESPANPEGNFNLSFYPTGVFFQSTKEYQLRLVVEAVGSDKSSVEGGVPFVRAEMVSQFQFANLEDDKELPNYFYANSIAIVFPYLRAFLSSLTLQSGGFHLLLPLMNLTSLGGELKRNTTIA